MYDFGYQTRQPCLPEPVELVAGSGGSTPRSLAWPGQGKTHRRSLPIAIGYIFVLVVVVIYKVPVRSMVKELRP